MNSRIYNIKDLSSLRNYSEIEYLETEQEPSNFKGKSIFAPRLSGFNTIVPKKVHTKKYFKNSINTNHSVRYRKKEPSAPLPQITKEQGSIVSFFPGVKSPKVFHSSPRVQNYFLKERFINNIQQKSVDLGCLRTIRYKLNE